MEKPQTWTTNLCVSTSNWRVTDVLLRYLLLNFTVSKIKANTMIVSIIKPNESRYIISNKAISIICTTSISRSKYYGLKDGKPHLFILISYWI